MINYDRKKATQAIDELNHRIDELEMERQKLLTHRNWMDGVQIITEVFNKADINERRDFLDDLEEIAVKYLGSKNFNKYSIR